MLAKRPNDSKVRRRRVEDPPRAEWPSAEELLETAASLHDNADDPAQQVATGQDPFTPYLSHDDALDIARDLRNRATDLARDAGVAAEPDARFVLWLKTRKYDWA